MASGSSKGFTSVPPFHYRSAGAAYTEPDRHTRPKVLVTPYSPTTSGVRHIAPSASTTPSTGLGRVWQGHARPAAGFDQVPPGRVRTLGADAQALQDPGKSALAVLSTRGPRRPPEYRRKVFEGLDR